MEGRPMSRLRLSRTLVVALALTLMGACAKDSATLNRPPATGATTPAAPTTRLDNATGFVVADRGTYKLVTVTRPAPKSSEKVSYVLVPRGAKAPDLTGDLAGATVVETPIPRMVSMSTTYLPMLDALGAVDVLVGVDNFDYVSTPSVRKLIDDGKLKATGANAQANAEVLAVLKPDIVMTSQTGDAASDGFDKMRAAGLKVVVNSDWLEETPLGRAEWIKFIGLFVGKEAQAQTTFAGVASAYRDQATKAAQATGTPKVLVNAPYQGTWYVPGGGSYAARLIVDAGGAYPWSDDKSTGALPLDVEAVFNKAGDATVWVNPSAATRLADLKAIDARFDKFVSFQQKNVWNNDAKTNGKGGNDYYETGALRPDLALADLVAIFHPELEPGHAFTWYRKLPET